MVYIQDGKYIDIVGFKEVKPGWFLNKFRIFREEHGNNDATVKLPICQAKFVANYCGKFDVNNPKRKALKRFNLLLPAGDLCLTGTEESIREGTANHVVTSVNICNAISYM